MLRGLILTGVLALAGCALQPQAPVPLQSTAIAVADARIGVAMTPMPTVDMHMPGAGCLLCIAAAAIANRELIDHARTLPLEDLPGLKEEVAKRIRAKGGNAVVIEQPIDLSQLASDATDGPNRASTDFRPLRERYGVDKLVVIDVRTLGMWRTYSAYIPTSDPKATLQGRGFMVDLTANTYAWYQPVNLQKASDRGWDEPPKFPGLTNAYFQVLEMGKDAFLKPFE